MKLLTSSIVILVLVAVSIGTASGATLFLSDKGLGAGPIMANPVITPVGGTNTLYLWADLGTTEVINGLGIDIVANTPSAVSASASLIENPNVVLGNRWNTPVNSGTPGSPELVGGIAAISVNAVGLSGNPALQGFDATYDVGSGFYLVGHVDYAYNGGHTDVFIETNATTCSYSAGGPLMGFGSGDDQVDPRTEGVRSTGWDAQIVPEPVTMTLLAMGGIAVLLRKRR